MEINMKKILTASVLAMASAAMAAVPYELGVAGYSFNKRTLDDSLAIMQKAGIRNLCVKDFHLKYDATDSEIAAFKAKCASFGVIPYALGPLYTKDVDAMRAYFAFAKRFGAKTIVGVPYEFAEDGKTRRPSRTLLAEIDKLVKEYDIRYAIHNHGPQIGELFPDVACGWRLVKDLDPRIGFCLDVGWEYGCGKDPAKTIREHGGRIYDVHFKDFEIGKPDGAATPLGRGKIDYQKVMQALADVGYTGVCSIEYEKDFEDNLAALAECAGYFRGVAKCIRAKAFMQPVPADANTLTEAEKAEGWELLFDGKHLPKDRFVGVKNECKEFPKKGWYVRDGYLTMYPMRSITEDGRWVDLPPEDQKLANGGDIVTIRKYRDFEMKFDFRLTWAANSGVKYYYNEGQHQNSCEEYQILDPNHPDYDKPNHAGVEGVHRIAALYDLKPAVGAEEVLTRLGEWNHGRIVARGSHVEHWLNGVKVLEYERGSAEFRKWVVDSKYAAWEDKGAHWGEAEMGRILLQDHSDSTVSFCNLKIREM